MTFRLFFAIGALVLGGCSATGPVFTSAPVSDDQAVIYVYRPSAFAHGGNGPQVTLDGKNVGKLSNGGYLSLSVSPGPHKIEQQYSFLTWAMRAEPVVINAQARKQYFVRLSTDAQVKSVGTIVWADGTVGFGPVDEKVGLAEIQNLKRSN